MSGTLASGRRDGASAPSAQRRPTPPAYPRRKPRPRMVAFDYRGPYAYHIVLRTQDRMPRFGDSSPARRCIDHLKGAAERAGFRLLAFCFMPDHLHALVLGCHDAADLIRFVQRFKQVTAFDFKRGTGLRLWQQSFYDRTLRVEENLGQVAAYIVGNPVRARLVTNYIDYPLSGGEYFEADGAKAPSLPDFAASLPPGGARG